MGNENVKDAIKAKVTQEWHDLEYYVAQLGSDDTLTVHARARWAVLDELWNELYPGEEY